MHTSPLSCNDKALEISDDLNFRGMRTNPISDNSGIDGMISLSEAIGVFWKTIM